MIDGYEVFGRRGLTRGAVVVIASDGWERGDLALLDGELATIARQADTLMWVNPLKGHEGFEPLAGGMQIALRHVDDVLEGHNLAALEAHLKAPYIVELIGKLGNLTEGPLDVRVMVPAAE